MFQHSNFQRITVFKKFHNVSETIRNVLVPYLLRPEAKKMSRFIK